MRKCLVLASLSILLPALAQAEIYRWVDENGVIHYSDSPHPGAEEVILPDSPPPAAASRTAPQRTLPTNGDAPPPATFDYERLAIMQPGSEETLWNIAGRLTVRLSLQPALRPGDRVRMYFDGQAREVSGLEVQLEEVWRGTHNLQAEVVNEAGELLVRSEPVRFHVQQTSIVNPN